MEFELDEMEQEAGDNLKSKLLSLPVLTLPRETGQFIGDPDASNGQLECVLLQGHYEKVMKPIAYWSRLQCSAERNYNTTHKECLAVVWSVLIVHPYLEGSNYVAQTGHQALRCI